MRATLVMPHGNDPPPNSTQTSRNPEPGTEARRRTVLIVDDEHLIADTITEILNESGDFDAVAIYSGTQALEEARKHPPDILIADVMMPEMDGIELAKEVRLACPSTRVVLLSGQVFARDLVKEAGWEGYPLELWAKPINPDVLLERLKGKRN